MSPFDAIRVSVRAIGANGLRSVLTVLGMVIGVASVIVLVAVGQGAQKGVQENASQLAGSIVIVDAQTLRHARDSAELEPGVEESFLANGALEVAQVLVFGPSFLRPAFVRIVHFARQLPQRLVNLGDFR